MQIFCGRSRVVIATCTWARTSRCWSLPNFKVFVLQLLRFWLELPAFFESTTSKYSIGCERCNKVGQPTCKSGSYWHTWGRNHILARNSFMELNRDIYFISIIMNVSFKTSSKSLCWQLKVSTICEHATCRIIFKRVKHFHEFQRFSSKCV